MDRNTPVEVVQEFVKSVDDLQTELQRLNRNIEKITGQQETVSNICEIWSNWMENSAVLKDIVEKQKILPPDLPAQRT